MLHAFLPGAARRHPFIAVVLASCLVGATGATAAAGPVITSIPFHPYRVPAAISPHAHADLEFFWSDHYGVPTGTPMALPDSGSKVLDQLGRELCDVQSNAFHYPVGDLELVYDYLKMPDADHPWSPYATSGVRVSGIPGVPDANHFDVYLYVPKSASNWGDAILGDGMQTKSNARYNYGQGNSDFWTAAEDTSSGEPLLLGSVQHRNSLMWPGPAMEQGVTTSWIAPNLVGIQHEFQHVFNNGQPRRYTEIFSRAAEVICAPPDSSVYDITYWKPLLPSDGLDSYNYEGWESFTAYLAYNFQGVQPGYAGRADDVLWRWAHGPERTFMGLALALDSLACPTCDYFNGLSRPERVGTFIHNWRIASFVDNFALDRHQYGFDPAFNFHPRRQMGAFQDRDGLAFDNSGVLPMELHANPGWRTESVSLDHQPGVAGAYAARPLRLGLWGSECCVVHSDDMAGAGTDTLTLSIVPEGLAACVADDSLTAACDTAATHVDYVRGRLRVSVVRYAQDGPDLYAHPEWVLGLETRSADVSVPSTGVTFQVPQFGAGGATKAVVVITTLEGLDDNSIRVDAPVRPLSGNSVPIRVVAGLGNVDTGPRLLAQGPRDDDYGAWSADGQTIFYQSAQPPDTAFTQVYRVATVGGVATRLFPQAHGQRRPDASPRGDWVAFEQDSVTGSPRLWLAGVNGASPHRLTATPGLESAPAFSPNGQQVAFAWAPLPGNAGTPALRVVDLDGSNAIDLAAAQPATIRWADDGARVYYTAATATPQPVRWVALTAEAGGARASGTADELGDVYDFDLRPFGGGDLAAEPNFTYTYECAKGGMCGAGSAVADTLLRTLPGRRVVLHRMTSGGGGRDTATVFATGAATAVHARWSPDGTRVLFAANRARPGDLDLYVATVTRNRPPVLSAGSIADAQGFVFARDLAATDADGQSLVYDVVPLPAGAKLAGNRLRWTPTPAQAGVHYLRLRAADGSGGVASRVIRVDVRSEDMVTAVVTGGGNESLKAGGLPLAFALETAGPNPTHGASRLVLALPRAATVRLDVIDTQGRLVKTLARGRLEAGWSDLTWDGRNTSGEVVRSGVYFARVQADAFVDRKRLVLLR